MRAFFAGPAGETRLALLIVALGILFRIAFFSLVSVPTNGGEAENVAIAIASGRGFADAFYVGSGPTAHLTPTTPVLAAGIFMLFGVNSDASHIVLMGWAFACFAASALLLDRLFRKLGASFAARMTALGVMCFLPIFIVPETMVFRFWDGQLVFALLLLSLNHGLAQRDRAPSLKASLISAIILAALVLLNPVIGLVAGFAYGITMLGHRPIVRLAAEAALVAALIAPPIALWTARNQAVIGAPIMLRDNLGLELAFKANDAVLRDGPNPETIVTQFNFIHPDSDGPGNARTRQIGEHAYKVEVQRQTMAWIADHPAAYAGIVTQGFLQFFFPSPLYFPEETAAFQTPMIWLVSALGLITILLMIRRRRPGWLVIGAVVLLIGAAYAPFVTLWRYFYPAYNLLLFAAACGIFELLAPRTRDLHAD